MIDEWEPRYRAAFIVASIALVTGVAILLIFA
jgi:hypothetical protein